MELLESEGAEAVVPDLTDFLLYCFYNTGFKADNLGMSQKSKKIGRLGINFFEWLRSAARDEFTKSRHFTAPAHIDDLARYARDIVSEGNQTGEGWFLTGEMLELIHTGTPNIVRLPAEPCGRQWRHQGTASPLSWFQYRGHRLRSGCQRGKPAQPYQADALHRKQKSGKAERTGAEGSGCRLTDTEKGAAHQMCSPFS